MLSGDALTMAFQPIADLNSGTIRGVEALTRIYSKPARPPNEWFAEATLVGRGIELEMAAVRAALARLDDLPSDAFLSVNVSPTTAASPELAAVLDDVAASRIVLELTCRPRR